MAIFLSYLFINSLLLYSQSLNHSKNLRLLRYEFSNYRESKGDKEKHIRKKRNKIFLLDIIFLFGSRFLIVIFGDNVEMSHIFQ
jgi:hypothetical protein